MDDRSDEITVTLGSVWTPAGRKAVVLQTNPSDTVTVVGPNFMRDYKHPQTAIKTAKRIYAHESNQAKWIA